MQALEFSLKRFLDSNNFEFQRTATIPDFCDFIVYSGGRFVLIECKNWKRFTWNKYRYKQPLQYESLMKYRHVYLFHSAEQSHFKNIAVYSFHRQNKPLVIGNFKKIFRKFQK